jgi:hypothetical protein
MFRRYNSPMTTTHKTIIAIAILIIIICGAGYLANKKDTAPVDLDTTPKNVTLSGKYVCLPHLDTKGPQTEECAFGLEVDEGIYYAVNFGASADAMMQFKSGEYITAEGSVVIKEALSSDQWQKYNMKGIFTITKVLKPSPVVAGGAIESCYTYSAKETGGNPFSVEEYLKLKISGNNVEGLKFGFQSGLGYSSGYNGTLLGTKTGTEVIVDYSYATAEGSHKTEQEVYKLDNESIEKIQYVLVDKGNVLVPDRTKEVNRFKYLPINCSILDEKLPR